MRVLLLLIAVATMLATGCGGGLASQSAIVKASATPGATDTTASPTPAPTWVSQYYVDRDCPRQTEPPAPPPGLPADAACVSSAEGIFDGTSSHQVLSVYSLRNSNGRHWLVRLDRAAAGQVLTTDLNAMWRQPTPLMDVFVLGVADARADGRDEAFILLHHGASTGFIGILGVARGQLVLAGTGTASGQQSFPLGGSVMHQGMLQCVGAGSAARLIVSGWGTNDGGRSFNWESTTYAWSGMRLTPVNSRSGSVTSFDDPQIKALGDGLRCNGFSSN